MLMQLIQQDLIITSCKMNIDSLIADFPDRKEARKQIKALGFNSWFGIAFVKATYPIVKPGAPSMVYEHIDSYKKDNVWRIQIRQRVPDITEIKQYLSYHYQNACHLIELMSELQGQKGITLDSKGIIYTFELEVK